MKIDLNIHHTCHSVAEFTAISARIAALLAEFSSATVPVIPNSAGLSSPFVAADPVLHTVAANTVPPAHVARSEPAAPLGMDGPAEAKAEHGIPAAFTAAVTDDKPKRTRRTKEQIAADEAAKAATVALPAPQPVMLPVSPPLARPEVPDIFAPQQIAPAKSDAPAISDRAALRPLMMQVFDLDGGEAIISSIFAPYGGSVAKVPEDKVGAVAVALNAAIPR